MNLNLSINLKISFFSKLQSTEISNEMNVFMYNLSDEIFMETIIYLQNFGLDYFEVIRTNLDKFDEKLLEVRSICED